VVLNASPAVEFEIARNTLDTLNVTTKCQFIPDLGLTRFHLLMTVACESSCDSAQSLVAFQRETSPVTCLGELESELRCFNVQDSSHTLERASPCCSLPSTTHPRSASSQAPFSGSSLLVSSSLILLSMRTLCPVSLEHRAEFLPSVPLWRVGCFCMWKHFQHVAKSF
jgi:hypothetical protein